jgi:hypothetical protein
VLAISHATVLPSVHAHDVGTPEEGFFEAQYSKKVPGTGVLMFCNSSP